MLYYFLLKATRISFSIYHFLFVYLDKYPNGTFSTEANEALENQKFETTTKEIFKEKLQNILKDDAYFFVDNTQTLPYTLHFALKNIKARELIRTLALDEIYISNGEGCSLGLSKPSRILS